MKIVKTTETEDWELFDYLLDLERKWRKSLPRFTHKELLGIFPEAKDVLSDKVLEWQDKLHEVTEIIKNKLICIKHNVAGDPSREFWRAWVKATDGEKLLTIESHIGRLKRLLSVADNHPQAGRITEEHIRQAKTVPIENLLNHHKLKISGKNLVGLCPLHNERTPSFYIYRDTNSCWCFGCSQGGDSIELAILLNGFGFIEAVKWLNKL